MQISTSILTIKEDKNAIAEIDKINTDFIHVDVMDGKFVQNTADFLFLEKMQKPLDIHFMVEDIEKYIREYAFFSPVYMTFHIEACKNEQEVRDIIQLIKAYNSKVGISISPDTKVEVLTPYLSSIDLVLVMSVYPGYGGQTFIENSVFKIKELKEYREKESCTYKIEVDGGINDTTCLLCKEADILVAGSYITDKENPSEQIEILKNKFI
ncbi:MAG: ribulose-phosphate 3-epimerase [Bacilli bacterium]|nr:ribulose-phosphate 3-epimerase [Bacilli bacterium]